MSTPWSRAHERALAKLKVRTHQRRERQPMAPMPDTNTGKARALVLDGVTYSSVTRAGRVLHCSPRKIYDLIAAGRGHFV